MRICIDPGHGGTDPGACASAAQEKNIVLDIGLKLKKLFIENGFDAIMTREYDTFDAPIKKAQKANQSGADLFVSLHCNSSTSEQAHGIETFAYGLVGKGYELAKAVQNELTKTTGLANRGVKDGRHFIVLNTTSMPAVLVEIGFISNKEERLLLITDNFQQKAAKAVCKGVCRYLGVEYKERSDKVEHTKAPEWKENSVKKAMEKGILNERHNPLEMVDMGTLCTMLLSLIEKE